MSAAPHVLTQKIRTSSSAAQYLEIMLLSLLPTLLLLLPTSAKDPEATCPRFSPQDVRAAVFLPAVSSRLEWVQATLEEAIQGLETLREKTKVIPEELRQQMGAAGGEVAAKEPEDLRALLGDLVVHAVRADQRAWARIVDTQADILEPERAPLAPRTLTDLRTEVEGLETAWKENEDSFEELLNSLGRALGILLSPMVSLMEGMVKMTEAGGPLAKEMGMEKLRSQVDNLMGRVLLRMVVDRQEDKQSGQGPTLFGGVTKLADRLAKDFAMKGRKLTLEQFWRGELELFTSPLTRGTEDEQVEDVLEREEVILIAHLVQKNMAPTKPLKF